MTVITRTSSPASTVVNGDTFTEWLRLDPNKDQATLDLLMASATDYLEGLTGRVV